jgi:hypothetical protein
VAGAIKNPFCLAFGHLSHPGQEGRYHGANNSGNLENAVGPIDGGAGLFFAFFGCPLVEVSTPDKQQKRSDRNDIATGVDPVKES